MADSIQGRSDPQSEEGRRQTNTVEQAQGRGGPVANEAGTGSQEVHNPSKAEGQHAGADAHHDARRLEEERAGQSELVQGRRTADISVVQAGILRRLIQVEKALQGQASQMAAWQSEEEYGDVPHARVPREVPQNEQHAMATGQHGRAQRAEVPERPSTVAGLTLQSQQMQLVVQASGAESGHFLAKLNYMIKLQLFHGNRPILGQEQRSWQEWQGEFIQKARLCKLDADMYHHMAEALLSTHMREVWLTYLRVKPEDNTWAGLDTYMGIHYAALDKTVDAKSSLREQSCCMARSRHGRHTPMHKQHTLQIWAHHQSVPGQPEEYGVRS